MYRNAKGTFVCFFRVFCLLKVNTGYFLSSIWHNTGTGTLEFTDHIARIFEFFIHIPETRLVNYNQQKTNRVIPSFAIRLALYVIELPSESNIVIASI